MDGNTVLIALVALIGINALITRTRLGQQVPTFFWGVQALNVAVGVYVVLFGLPGFERTPIVRLVIGLLVMLHIAQNFHAKVTWDGVRRAERLQADHDERHANGSAQE